MKEQEKGCFKKPINNTDDMTTEEVMEMHRAILNDPTHPSHAVWVKNCLIEYPNPYKKPEPWEPWRPYDGPFVPLPNPPKPVKDWDWAKIIEALNKSKEAKPMENNMFENVEDYVRIEYTDGGYQVFDATTNKLLCTCPGPFELTEVVKGIVLRKISKKLA